MAGYEHPVRTCFFRWAIDSPYEYAELLGVLGLHLPPCVCGERSSSVRFLWTQIRDMNVQKSSTLLSTLGLWMTICQQHSTYVHIHVHFLLWTYILLNRLYTAQRCNTYLTNLSLRFIRLDPLIVIGTHVRLVSRT